MMSLLQKWQDIVKEVKFLKQCQHENTIGFKGCYLKDSTCWVRREREREREKWKRERREGTEDKRVMMSY